MTTKLSHDEMLAIIDAHGGAEQARDFDGAWNTMVDDPFYEFFPYGLHITGREAITELWSRIFAESGTIRCFSLAAHVPGEGAMQRHLGDDAVVDVMRSAFFDEGGVRHGASYVVRYAFDDEGLKSESLWLDRELLVYFDQVFDDSFRALPGVEEI
jgi:hypothetical protein